MGFLPAARGEMSRRRAAFTLVEMLVVVAIIGILAALLMPSLHNALGAARTTVCANFLKQVGVANATYVSDWSGYCIPNAQGPSSNRVGWGSNSSFQEYMRMTGCFGSGWSYQYHCPDSGYRQVTPWNSVYLGYRICLYGASYGMNYQNSGASWNDLASTSKFIAVRYNKLRSPGQTTMIIDSAQAHVTMPASAASCGYYTAGDGVYPPQCTYAPRHQNKGNANHLFFDGHAQSIPAFLACGNTGLWNIY